MSKSTRHATEATPVVRKDGDFDAVIVQISNTGASGAVEQDRYRHTITHGLGRVPVGCCIIHKDAPCDVYVLSSNENEISVKFTAAETSVNLRIW